MAEESIVAVELKVRMTEEDGILHCIVRGFLT